MSIEPYLDERRLSSTNLARDFLELSQVLRAILREDLRARKRSTIYEVEVRPELDFATFLYSKGNIDEDLRLALMVQVDQMPNWDEGEVMPAPTTVEFAQRRRGEGAATFCIVLRPHFLAQIENGVYVVADEADLRVFLRAVPELLDLSEQEFISHCVRCYDRLFFKRDIYLEIKKFSRGYRSIRKDLSAAFAALNDELSSLLDQKLIPKEIANRFGTLTDFELSPESPNTHKNKKAMAEREVVVGESAFMCEWHLKLEAQRDRIHVHFYDDGIGNGRQILIGIFCEHLTI
jgi:hypothetical protein